MKVLGIDPGYDRLGIAVLSGAPGKEVCEYSACLQTDKKASIPDRLYTLGARITECIATHTPDCLAIETLYFNTNQKTAIAVAEARGMILYLARLHGLAVYEYTPQQVKVAVTGYGKSDKAHVASMLARLIPNLNTTTLDDEYDAIAIALTCLASVRSV